MRYCDHAVLCGMKSLYQAARPARDEILKMPDGLKNEKIPREQDNRLRAELFGGIPGRGDRMELLALIRTLREKRAELAREAGKMSASDDNVLKKAEKIINGEFGLALSIPPEEVPAFIAARLHTEQ